MDSFYLLLKIFITLKSDCRLLLTSLHDNDNKNNTNTKNNTTTTTTTNDNDNNNNDMIEFERKYEFFETLKSNEQIILINELYYIIISILYIN